MLIFKSIRSPAAFIIKDNEHFKKSGFKTRKLNFQICFVTFMSVITHLKTIYSRDVPSFSL